MTLRAPDDYEAEFMAAPDGVLHREKISYPKWFMWFFPAALLGMIGFAAASAAQAGDVGGAGIALAMLPVLAAFWVMMSTLRVTVSRSMVSVQYGPLGPKIPLDRIELVEAEDYEVWRYGGYGIRYSMLEGAWCYNMLGDQGKAVRIHYRNERGALKKLLIASQHHHLLADKINQARGVATGIDDATLGLDDEVYFSEVTGAVTGDIVQHAGEVELDMSTEQGAAAVEQEQAEVAATRQ